LHIFSCLFLWIFYKILYNGFRMIALFSDISYNEFIFFVTVYILLNA
jgi:general stress protein CsbA